MTEQGGEVDPRIIDSLKSRPRTEFGQLHGEDIAERVKSAPGSYHEHDLSERVITEEAVKNLEQIINDKDQK